MESLVIVSKQYFVNGQRRSKVIGHQSLVIVNYQSLVLSIKQIPLVTVTEKLSAEVKAASR